MFNGRIIKGVGGTYCVSHDGEITVCTARGVFRKEKITPCIGDFVTVNDANCIVDIDERKNILVRPPVANIDHLGIVVSAELPVADTLMLDKLTVSARYLKIEPFVIINKCDVGRLEDIKKIEDHLKNTDIPYIASECVTSDGLEKIVSYLKPGVTAFAGQSGVGKTSILHALHPEEESLEVGELSDKLKRGKHTTRHVELHEVGDGIFVMDTPGFSKYDTEVAKIESLGDCYPEFKRFSKFCAFNSCTHIHEPNCAIKEAVESGEISRSRYENYIKIYEQIKQRKAVYK